MFSVLFCAAASVRRREITKKTKITKHTKKFRLFRNFCFIRNLSSSFISENFKVSVRLLRRRNPSNAHFDHCAKMSAPSDRGQADAGSSHEYHADDTGHRQYGSQFHPFARSLVRPSLHHPPSTS